MYEVFVSVGAAALTTWAGAGIVTAIRTNGRLVKLETTQEAFEKWLVRIESKLDRAIERKGH